MGNFFYGIFSLFQQGDMWQDLGVGIFGVESPAFDRDIDIKYPVVSREQPGNVLCIASRLEIPGLEANHYDISALDVG